MLDRRQEFVGVETNRLCERADVGARVDAGGEPVELAGIDQPKHGWADAGPLRDVAQLQAGGEPCLLQPSGGRPCSHRLSHRMWSPSEVLQTGGEPAQRPQTRPLCPAPDVGRTRHSTAPAVRPLSVRPTQRARADAVYCKSVDFRRRSPYLMRLPTCFRWVWRHPHPPRPPVQVPLMEVHVTRFPCRISVLPLAALVFVVATGLASAQSGTAGLRGTVMDEQGAHVPGATITLANRQHRVFARDGGGWHWRIPVRCHSAWHLHCHRRVGGLPHGRVRQASSSPWTRSRVRT